VFSSLGVVPVSYEDDLKAIEAQEVQSRTPMRVLSSLVDFVNR
jgi:hypothetical protein